MKAFIVLRENIEKNEETLIPTLQQHVKELTAPYKYPRKIEFVDELPKTISGKIRVLNLENKRWRFRQNNFENSEVNS